MGVDWLTDPLDWLDEQVDQSEGQLVIVPVERWDYIVRFVPVFQLIPATSYSPAAFWYRDKKIVTPSYWEAEVERMNARLK